jgi:hypothetical protein
VAFFGLLCCASASRSVVASGGGDAGGDAGGVSDAVAGLGSAALSVEWDGAGPVALSLEAAAGGVGTGGVSVAAAGFCFAALSVERDGAGSVALSLEAGADGSGGGIGAVATGACSTVSGFAGAAFSPGGLAAVVCVLSFTPGASLSAVGCGCSGPAR